MLPGFDFLPVEEVLWMKREELMREFESIRLVRAARIANPGFTERAWVRVGEFLIRAGLRLRDRVMRPRQSYLDSAARYAA
jgi:hypothetical protein